MAALNLQVCFTAYFSTPISSTFKHDQAKLQGRPSESDLPAQLHGCPLALLLLPIGMTREKLKEASQDEGNEEDHDGPEGH